jgi:hypothetical protein
VAEAAGAQGVETAEASVEGVADTTAATTESTTTPEQGA